VADFAALLAAAVVEVVSPAVEDERGLMPTQLNIRSVTGLGVGQPLLQVVVHALAVESLGALRVVEAALVAVSFAGVGNVEAVLT
jgi:hypothetical protein